MQRLDDLCVCVCTYIYIILIYNIYVWHLFDGAQGGEGRERGRGEEFDPPLVGRPGGGRGGGGLEEDDGEQ
jgi:hypothetical protein